MKEKPALPDQQIIDHVRDAFGVSLVEVAFLPIGDISSAKYRAVSEEAATYFLKLRRDSFSEIAVLVPHFLHEQGISQVLSPLATKDGRLWTTLDGYTCILYPFVAGHNGFQDSLTREQWAELGAVLKRVHAVTLPPNLRTKIPSEAFAATWRERVKGFLEEIDKQTYTDPVAAKMAAVLREHRDEIAFVVARAEALAVMLQSQPVAQVLCHTDIHAGNLLLEANGALHLIDWDDPLLAPKERDLMFIGGGIGGVWNTAAEEVLFYQGYGKTDVNQTALTYYRYERIVADIAAFSQQILETTEGRADRERSFEKFLPIFLPHQVLAIADQTDRMLRRRLDCGR